MEYGKVYSLGQVWCRAAASCLARFLVLMWRMRVENEKLIFPLITDQTRQLDKDFFICLYFYEEEMFLTAEKCG